MRSISQSKLPLTSLYISYSQLSNHLFSPSKLKYYMKVIFVTCQIIFTCLSSFTVYGQKGQHRLLLEQQLMCMCRESLPKFVLSSKVYQHLEIQELKWNKEY